MTTNLVEQIQIQSNLLEDQDLDPRWASGPFLQLKTLSAKAKGKRFEQIAQAIFTHKKMSVKKAESSDHDRIVDGKKFEIKGSTITKGHDDWFSFLQIRPKQDYDYLVLEAFFFDGTVKFFKIDKAAIATFIERRIFKPQHGGNSGNSGTFCYNGTLDPLVDYFWFEIFVTR
jgi:hypothetical protein